MCFVRWPWSRSWLTVWLHPFFRGQGRVRGWRVVRTEMEGGGEEGGVVSVPGHQMEAPMVSDHPAWTLLRGGQEVPSLPCGWEGGSAQDVSGFRVDHLRPQARRVHYHTSPTGVLKEWAKHIVFSIFPLFGTGHEVNLDSVTFKLLY